VWTALKEGWRIEWAAVLFSVANVLPQDTVLDVLFLILSSGRKVKPSRRVPLAARLDVV
jgi:hypothetical protein